jgi:benzoate-CoA ligase
VGERDAAGVQRPVAYVVPAAGTVIDVASLEVLCQAELAGYKRPRRYQVLAELPKTATGKIQRYKLRA